MRVRIAGLFVRDGREILFARHAKDGEVYWLLPGGGLERGESIADAFAREMREELGVAAEIDDLQFLLESLAPDGKRHVLNLVFRGRLTGGGAGPFASTDPRVVGADWFDAAAIKELRLYPDMRDELVRLLQGAACARVHLGVRWNE